MKRLNIGKPNLNYEIGGKLSIACGEMQKLVE
jgi:hypothetical protein